jgi:hypothetical protein
VRKTFNKLLAEYGVAAVVVYFTLFFGIFFGAWAGIRYGWDPRPLVARIGLNPNGLVASAGPWLLAYGVTKVLQPVRIAATLLLTPVVAKLYERATGRAPVPIATPAAPAPAEPAATRAK